MAAPCAFWAKGNCKNGDRCRFEHIGPAGGGGGGRGGGAYEPRGGNTRGAPRGARGDHYEPRPPAQNFPDNYREPQGYGGRGGPKGGYQGGYQGGRQDDRSAYQAPPQRGGYQGAQQPRGGYQNDHDPRSGRGGRGRGGRDHRAPPPTPAVPQNKYLFDKDTLYADLTSEIPGWILSAYCPGTKAPVQLFGGEDREKSFEEMRLNHYMLREQGQEALAAQQQDELVQKALAQNENARNNVEAAVQYILQGDNEHPNRIDIAEQYTKGLIDCSQPPPPHIQAIIHGALPNTVAPAQLPQNVDAFGRPISQHGQDSFGTPSAPAAAPFGQQQGAFGQQPQNTNPLAPAPFGQPQQAPQLGGGGAFGQPQQQQQQNPFGQPQLPQQNQLTGFNQLAQNVFGQPQHQQQAGAFGSSAMRVEENPLSAFNQSQTQQSQAPNPFSSMSMNSAGPFPTPPTSFQPQAQPPQQPPNGTMPFGGHLQPLTPQSSPFVQQQAQQPQRQQQQQQSQPQAQPQAQQPARDWSIYGKYAADAERFARLAAEQPIGTGHSPIVGTYINVLTHQLFPGPWTDPSPYQPGSMIQHPHVSLYTTRDPQTGRLLTFKDMRVEYRDEEGARVPGGQGTVPGFLHADGWWEKIWFPNGPPGYNPDTEADEGGYTEEDAKAYAHLEETGRFPGDKIPRNPPKREWTHWCF